MPLMNLMMVLQWLYPVVILITLLASLRYARLSKSSPVLSGGLGLMFAANLASKLMPMLGSRLIHLTSSSADTFYTSPYYLMTCTLSIAAMFAWALIAYGLYSVMEEVSQKLAFVNLASENGWNYNAAPNQLRGQTLQPQQVQSPFVQTPQPQMPQHQPVQEQSREESHAPAYVSPVASAAPVQDSRPVVSVQSEQPDAPLTLGSGRQ